MSAANFVYMYESLEGVEMTQEMYLSFIEVKNLMAKSMGLTNDHEVSIALICMASIAAKDLADREDFNHG
jgi:hypothetical protein